jgi:hypothetical protein
MANNSGTENDFKKSLEKLKERGEIIAKAKFGLFTRLSMMPARPSSARPATRKVNKTAERFIPLKVLIEDLIVKKVAKPASRAVAKPAFSKVARPATSKVARPATRTPAATTSAISLSSLGQDNLEVIGEQLIIAENSKYTLKKYKFVDGIPEKEIAKYPARLLQNRNALYYLTEKADYKVKKDLDYFWLSSNTNPVAIELIKKALEDDKHTYINWEELCKNPSAAVILLNRKYRGSLKWDAMSKNTNPEVIKFLAKGENYEHINWENLSGNESRPAIALLQKRIITDPWNITRHQVSRNSGAMGILMRYEDKVTGDGLSANTAEDAYYLLVKILEKEPKDINWASLSANPSVWAYSFLQKEENKKHIRWDMVSKNTSDKAIELLEKRIEVENELSKSSEAVYKALPKNQKIDWLEVSKNPSAIELIKERIKYEAVLIRTKLEYYEKLKPNEKISYEELAKNPSIFVKVGRTRPVAAKATPIPRASPTPRASPIPRASPTSQAVREAAHASQAARAERAAAANTVKFNAELERLRTYLTSQRPHLTSQRHTASQAPVYRTTPRTPRVAALTATRTGARDIGRPKLPPKARASARI